MSIQQCNIEVEPVALRTFRQTHGYCKEVQKIELKCVKVFLQNVMHK